ncbi:MAG: M28 family peptidase [Pyrinomonadaceae bacterium]
MFRQRSITLFLVVAFLSPALAFGQSTAPAVYTAPKESIDRIRDEGMNRSQVMQTLSYMTDVIGARLTGSPNMKRANEWTRDKMKEWGMQNAHLESWGPFGRGWSLKTYSAAVVEPQFIAVNGYPKAWSPSTKGTMTGDIVLLEGKTAADLEKYKGKLNGKIVFVSAERPLKANEKAYSSRLKDETLEKMAAEPAKDDGDVLPPAAMKNIREHFNEQAVKIKFLIGEGAAVMVDNSGGGSGGTIFVQGASVGVEMGEIKSFEDLFASAAFQPQNKKYEANMLPQMTLATEDYNRIVRMIKLGGTPKMSVNIDTRYHDEDPMSYNTIAEIPGSDPALKDEVVMLGAHLDSWHSATGATDNGAGSAAVMEAARIIVASGLKPRRTIRVGLWSGEEEVCSVR